ncbi:hypothetical protein FRC08_006918 [Ceratobasidium sp. 394]|nr:hypothetical protein FRC08_006918 [Ceratobasidium sp. 394]
MAAADVHASKKRRSSYPSDMNPTTLEDARRQVSSSRARLSRATEDYLAACQLLASTCVPQPQSSNQHSRELVLSAIDTELSAFKEGEERIQKTHQVLVNARNRSKMTAPIYSLPPEILTRIFLEAACHHAHDESKRPTSFPSNPTTLSTVCRLWRNMAINCRSLWSHLDILIDAKGRQPRYPPSQLWIDRLQGMPLRVHIRLYGSTPRQHLGTINLNDMSDSDDPDDSDGADSSDDSGDSDNSRTSASAQHSVSRTPNISLSSLTNFLAPLMSHADSLELISSMHCQSLLHSMLDRLITDNEEPGPMRAVRIIHDGEDCDPLECETSHLSLEHDFEDHRVFFSSLVTLDLRNVYPFWDYMTLTNLVELRFEAPGLKTWFAVTQAELAATLASCPKLQSLTLFRLRVTPVPARIRPYRVVLDDLRVLSLRCMAWYGELKTVISMIHPGPHPLHLSLHLPERHESNPEFLVELRSFIRRSNVTVFYADSFGFDTWFASQLGPLPNVHTLVLCSCHMSDIAGTGTNRYINPCPIDPSVVLWPQLRKLYLLHCGLDKAHVYRLLSLHAIQTLYLQQCFDDTLPEVNWCMTVQSLEKYRPLLSHLIPEIKILKSDAHADTKDWLFVGTPM